MNTNEVKRTLNDIAKIRDFFNDGGVKGFQAQHSGCDKIGFGFNVDHRFTTLETKISLDSWYGFYGNSGCSRLIGISSTEVFNRALVGWLNKNIEIVLLGACEFAERECAKEVSEIRAQSEELKKLADDLESITKENA